MVGRRRFLMLGLGGSAAALVGGTSLRVAADSPTLAPVWRLSADWGYAVPPKNRTRCRCQACRNHAANKVFASKSVALANRIHPCCVCQPYSIDLLAADAASLFIGSSTGDTIDLRNAAERARFEAATLRSLAPVSAPSTDPVSTPAPPAATVSTPDPAPAEPDSSQATAAQTPAALPVTGTDYTTLLAAATVVVAAGAVAVVSASASESVEAE